MKGYRFGELRFQGPFRSKTPPRPPGHGNWGSASDTFSASTRAVSSATLKHQGAECHIRFCFMSVSCLSKPSFLFATPSCPSSIPDQALSIPCSGASHPPGQASSCCGSREGLKEEALAVEAPAEARQRDALLLRPSGTLSTTSATRPVGKMEKVTLSTVNLEVLLRSCSSYCLTLSLQFPNVFEPATNDLWPIAPSSYSQ